MWLITTLLIARASVVDRVVAVVEDQVVLASDVALDRELSARDPSPIPFWGRGRPMQRQIDAAVLRAAAGDVALYQPTTEAKRERLEGLRASFEDRARWLAFLDRWGLDESTMSSVLERRMVVEAYLQRNLQTPATNRPTWNAECTVLLAELAPRVRVRIVPPHP